MAIFAFTATMSQPAFRKIGVVWRGGRPHSRSAELTGTPQKRDTKKGPRRQEAPPLPNSAHGDQLISAKPRRTARLLSDLHM